MKDKLKELHQKARIARDPAATEAYGAALAAIQEGEVRANENFSDSKVLAIVEKEAGKFAESAAAFEKAGREDKAAEIAARAELLEALLPEKLDADAYPKLVADAVEATGASSMRDMGAVMAKLKADIGPALDMKLASSEVKKVLG
ncbi:GatB/YqeY domain-containing protein [Pelagicoccus sp. SDUM812002]|uniref:GatB/YqeY domain-containing protein n=1 Tax=Pelagicoccus sp. SDUM812002 TaxID=3041266 RepID=UPI00280F0D97|nr:GatB/YqeY domain-containing protein [Pelagicoccus sp. SDUM812002]MDQ8185479.1 GatB/YqeY domain-containing protein [Pelagicoccus sp. SDUM812002]